MSVIQLNEHREGMMKILMTDISTERTIILGVMNNTNELIMAILKGDPLNTIKDCLNDDGLYDTDKIIGDYNANDKWEAHYIGAYIEDETIDLIIN